MFPRFMQTKKDIAIIIPYINLPNYILDLLGTILTKYSYHIYLIDNNSDKQTKKNLIDLDKRGYITIIYNNTNIGCASAWNQGVRAAIDEHNIDYAVVLNNDILLHKDCIDNMIKEIKLGGFPFVSAFDVCKDCAKPFDVLDLNIPEKKFIVDAPEFSCYTLSVALLNLFKTKENIFEEYRGLFDQKFYPAYFEDNDFHYRLKLVGMRAVKINIALYYHYGSRTTKENEEVGIVSNTFYLTNQQRYIEKWGDKPGKEKFKIPFNLDNE